MADHYDDRGINYSRLLRASTFYGLATEESNELAAVHAPTLVNKLTLAIEAQQHTGHYYTEAEHEAAQKAIAAHEAKRMPPEEWMATAVTLIYKVCGASISRERNPSEVADAYSVECFDRLIAHISTPPAGMVLVPNTPVAYRVYFDDCQEFYDNLDDPGLIDRMTNHGAELTPLYEAQAPMIAAAKEQK